MVRCTNDKNLISCGKLNCNTPLNSGSVYFSSGGDEHVVISRYGPNAALAAAFLARRNPKEEDRANLGQHPARSGSTYLAAVS